MIFDKNIEHFSVDMDATVEQLLKKIENSPVKFSCVVGENDRLMGVISYGDIIRAITTGEFSRNLRAQDVMNSECAYAFYGSGHSTIRPLVGRYRFLPLVDEMKRVRGLVHGDSNVRQFVVGQHKILHPTDFILVAEIGNNHNGSLDLAKSLVDAAKSSGANIAKFQMRDLSTLYGGDNGSADLSTEYVVNLLSKVSLSDEDMFRCFDYCHKIGITPLCTPFDFESLKKLEIYGLEGYKIASADLTNSPLYSAIIETNKPVITSSGMSTDDEIDAALSLLEKGNGNFALLHANSTYPTPYADVHLNYINNLKERTSSVVGYSGHERGWHIAVAAFALGAQVIEKHFTLNKSMEGNDHKVSLLPDEFHALYRSLSDTASALGDGHRRVVTQGESNNKIALAKSIFCRKQIDVGDVIGAEHLEIRSPGNGLSPRLYSNLMGTVASRAVDKGQAFYLDDIYGNSSAASPDFPVLFKWSIPVRHRDVYQLHRVFNPPSVEFHLSFKDLELDDQEILTQGLGSEVIVHAPEQFDEDFIIDLFSEDEAVADKSIMLLNKVFRKAERIALLINNQSNVKVVVNCGGHSQKDFIQNDVAYHRIQLFRERFSKLDIGNCRFLAQTMPPFPWHFGGQSFHNQFTSAENIRELISGLEREIEICLDVSHSFMWCKHAAEDFNNFVREIAPYVSHIHISDAQGTTSEGLQIGLGDVDFSKLLNELKTLSNQATLLPEIWQGHENDGKGFRVALNRLHKYGY